MFLFSSLLRRTLKLINLSDSKREGEAKDNNKLKEKTTIILIITVVIVIGVVLYQLRKKLRKRVVRKRKKPHKKVAKALTKFILHCKKKNVPKKEIKKSLMGKGWPKRIVEEYMKEVFSK